MKKAMRRKKAQMPSRGILIVLSGPSGSGKGTILKKMLEKSIDMKLSISATTRSPRIGEKHGEDYYFISKAEFIQLISKNEVLEHTEYCENYYGTPTKQVNEWLEKGKDVVLEIEVDGGTQIKKKSPSAINIFILPPSLKVLKERLIARNTESIDVIEKRLQIALKEIKEAYNYDYVVINDSLDECVEKICSIINLEKNKLKEKFNIIREVLENV